MVAAAGQDPLLCRRTQEAGRPFGLSGSHGRRLLQAQLSHFCFVAHPDIAGKLRNVIYLVPDNVWMWVTRQCALGIVPWELVNPCRNRGHFSDTCQDAGFTLGKEYSMWCWIWIGEIVFQGTRGPGHIPCRDLLLWEEKKQRSRACSHDGVESEPFHVVATL